MNTSHCPADHRPLVLASASPRREALLRGLGLHFQIDASDAPETLLPGDIQAVVSHLAMLKAREVAARHEDGLIVAADTLVALGDRIFGKPRDAEDARSMLSAMSGACHRAVTGLVVLDAATGRHESHVEETSVYFRQMRPEEIDAYIATGEPFDKAGAYGIQGLGSVFVERIDGDYSNVFGLPLAALNDLLRRMGCCLICRRLRDMLV